MSVRLGFAEGPAGHVAVEAELAAFLGRLVRWDRSAVVRLRSAEGEPALGVFGQPPFGGVLAVKSLALRGDAVAVAVDATVSAGGLLDAVAVAAGGEEFTLPPSVTGSAWAGVLPPRDGWRRLAGLDAASVREVALRMVAEFRERTEALVPEQRTRAELDSLAEELWERPLPGNGSGVTLRVVHAAHALGFLPAQAQAGSDAAAAASCGPQPEARSGPEAEAEAEAGVGTRSGAGDEARSEAEAQSELASVAVLAAGPWLRLRTAYGSVAVRDGSAASGLTVSPT